MKLKKFYYFSKKIKIIIMLLIFLLGGLTCIYLFKSFAVFTEEKHFNVINGTVGDPGDVYMAYYVNDEITCNMPKQNTGYTLDAEKSKCTNGVTVSWDDNNWHAILDYSSYKANDYTRTRCELYFKAKEYTVNFETGNLLPEYDESVFFGGSTFKVEYTNNLFKSTTINFTTDSSYKSNSFNLILKKDEPTLTYDFFFYIENNQSVEKDWTYTGETGNYTLETRLNGSGIDVRNWITYLFTNGTTYHAKATTKSGFSNTIWFVEDLSLSIVIPSEKVNYGDNITKPDTNIYKPGYTVGNKWYTDYERTNEFDFNTPITSDITLYAGMEKNS